MEKINSLQKLLDSISFAAEGLDEASRLAMRSELETELEAVKHAEDRSGVETRLRMLDKYMDKCQASESVIGIDADIESLRHISSELLDSFEFDGEKKNAVCGAHVVLPGFLLWYYIGLRIRQKIAGILVRKQQIYS